MTPEGPGKPSAVSAPEINEFVAATYPALSRTQVKCVRAVRGEVETVWRHQEEELRPGGYISGVTQFTVADASLWFVTFTLIGLEAMAVTADLQLTFLRPAQGGDLHGLGTLLSQGRRRFHGSVKLWVGEERDRLVAHASGTYITPN